MYLLDSKRNEPLLVENYELDFMIGHPMRNVDFENKKFKDGY